MYRLTVSVLAALALLFSAVAEAAQTSGHDQKAVLVTGASTGIGRKITEYLAARGTCVFAGARKTADLDALGKIPNVQPIRLDVTSTADIAAAVNTVTKSGRGLYGLINNAGIGTSGPILKVTQEEFEQVMAVNVYGPYRLTQAFAPLIIAQKGRIVTVSSIMGFLAAKDVSLYSMSKHAMEAFGDSLAAEIEPLGVKVSLIEPGTYRTELFRTAAQRGVLDPKVAESSLNFKEPDDVAAAAALALFEPAPKRRYLVVPEEPEARLTIKKQIERLVQLNEGQRYSYDRQTLVNLLDEALAGARPRAE